MPYFIFVEPIKSKIAEVSCAPLVVSSAQVKNSVLVGRS